MKILWLTFQNDIIISAALQTFIADQKISLTIKYQISDFAIVKVMLN